MALAESHSKKVYLIDASAFIFRAYYAMAPLSSKGRPSHAVQGFASMLLKLLSEKKPKSCVVVFDSKRPTFRKELYPLYKANREVPPPDLSGQIEASIEMCRKAGFPILQDEGFEADDWIASFVRNSFPDEKVIIISSDKDLMQLIDDRVQMYDSFRDRLIGGLEVTEKWGVRPDQVRDLLALTGDSSDNIPGLPGVGPKTAAKLLSEHQTIEGIYKNLEQLPQKLRQKFEESREILDLSMKLVSLKDDLNLPFQELPSIPYPFPPEFKDFLQDWELHRVLKQFEDQLGQGSLNSPTNSAKAKQRPVYTLIQSQKELDDLQAQLQKQKIFSFDCESDSFDREEARVVGVSFCFDLRQAFYVPWRHQDQSLDPDKVFRFLKAVLEDKNTEKCAHNSKYDLQVLLHDEIEVKNLKHDTMILAYLLHADRRSFSLDNLAQDFLSEEKEDLRALLEGSENFGAVAVEKAVIYAAKDAWLCFQLFELFQQGLGEETAISWLYQNVEMPLVQILAKMETAGVLLDEKYLKNLSAEMHTDLNSLEKKIHSSAGYEFNLASPKQLSKLLFEDLGLKPVKKTKTGFSTNEAVLLELENEHEVPRLILEHRKLAKLTSTYVDVLPALLAKRDRRLHTHYHQTGTMTGRLSSSEPNLQNIPTRSEEGRKIREAFVPEKGFVFLSADYSQIELRLMAHFSKDQKMIEAFVSGRDIHSETAKIIFGSDAKEFRSKAKAINFGIIYGISAFGLSQQLKISRSEAKSFIDSYFEQFPGIKTFMESCVELARQKKYTETLFGRKRPLPDIDSKNPMLRQNSERIAINAPLQGTAADLMKWAMIQVNERLKDQKLKSRLLLQVHDELVLEVFEGEQDRVRAIAEEGMLDFKGTPGEKLLVPLVVDVSIGSNWAAL